MKQQKSLFSQICTVKFIISIINRFHIIFLLIACFLPFFLISWIFPGRFEKSSLAISNLFHRARYHVLGKEKVSPSLYVITIDDNDIEELKIDWNNREIFADFFDILKEAPVKTVAFDILFKDRNSKRGDDRLVKKTRESGNIFYPVILNPEGESTGLKEKNNEILEQNSIYPRTGGKGPDFGSGDCIVPFYDLAASSAGIGDISVVPCEDTIVHKISLIRAYRKGYLPSLVLVSILNFFDVDPKDIRIVFGKHVVLPDARYPDGSVKDIVIPIDNQGKMNINYSGPWYDSIKTYPIREVFKAAQERSEQIHFIFRNSFVIVTDISSTNNDIYRGIFESSYPHSGILMNGVNTILTENYLRKPAFPETAAGMLICLVLLCLLAVKLKTGHFIPAVMVLCLLIAGAGLVLFFTTSRLPDFMSYLAATIFATGVYITYTFILFLKHEKKLADEYGHARLQLKEKDDEITRLHKDGILSRQKMVELFSEYGLSPREKEVIPLLKLGMQRKEIAWEMKISEHTIHDYFKNIYRKCNVSSSIELLQIFKD